MNSAAATSPTSLPIPRAPGRLPWIGHAMSLFNKPLAFLSSLENIGPLVRVDIGSLPMIVVTDPSLTKQVLTDSRTFDKGGSLYDKVLELTGESLLTSRSDSHRRQRRLMQPAFSQSRIKTYAVVMNEEIDAVLGELRDGAVVDIPTLMYEITSRTSARTMFAARVAGPAVTRIVDALSIYLNGLFIRMMAPSSLFTLVPTPGNIRYRRAVKTLHESVDEIIAAYRASRVDHGDLLSMLLAVDDEGTVLSSQEIHNQVISLFLAGVETTASLLSWSIYLLGENSDVAQSLYAEADAVLKGRSAQWDDLPRLPETKRIVTETLRMYPPGWIFTRVTMEDTVLGGYHLPAGTGIAFSPYLLHRSPEAFEEPERFDPNRWLAERARNLSKDSFIPFGGGAHKCIGDQFGLTEATMTLATIASRWTVRSTLRRPVEPAPHRATLTPGALPMRVSLRKNNAF